MKTRIIGKIAIAAASLAVAQGAGAAVLAGFYHYEGRLSDSGNPEYADVLAPGMLGWMESPTQASQGGNGCMDGYYGNSGIQVGAGPIWGDGYATVRVSSNGTSSTLSFFLKNSTSSAILLPYLFFDAAAKAGLGNEVKVDFVTNAGTLWSGNFPGLPSTSPQDFADFGVPVNYSLAADETVKFVFTAAPGSVGGTTLWVDNLAVAVPEPSVLTLGSVLALGLCLRRRRG